MTSTRSVHPLRRPARRLAPALALVVLLSSCRTWHAYPEVPPADMVAAVQSYLRERFPERGLSVRQGVDLEVGFSDTRPLLFLICLFFTAGLFLPIDEAYDVAVRPGSDGGTDLAVDVEAHWQVFYFMPMWLHDEPLERKTREAIVAQALRRGDDQAGAARVVEELLAAVRARDAVAFRDRLWENVPDGDPQLWFDSPELLVEGEPGQVSWPPHERSAAHGPKWFGLVSATTSRHEALWVTVKLAGGPWRFEVVRDGRWRVVPPVR